MKFDSSKVRDSYQSYSISLIFEVLYNTSGGSTGGGGGGGGGGV